MPTELVPIVVMGIIAIAGIILLHRLTHAKARQMDAETDTFVADFTMDRGNRQALANDREPRRTRNRDTAEHVYDYVLGLTNDERQARGEAAYAQQVLHNGGTIKFTHNGIDYEHSSNSSETKQFSRH